MTFTELSMAMKQLCYLLFSFIFYIFFYNKSSYLFLSLQVVLPWNEATFFLNFIFSSAYHGFKSFCIYFLYVLLPQHIIVLFSHVHQCFKHSCIYIKCNSLYSNVLHYGQKLYLIRCSITRLSHTIFKQNVLLRRSMLGIFISWKLYYTDQHSHDWNDKRKFQLPKLLCRSSLFFYNNCHLNVWSLFMYAQYIHNRVNPMLISTSIATIDIIIYRCREDRGRGGCG